MSNLREIYVKHREEKQAWLDKALKEMTESLDDDLENGEPVKVTVSCGVCHREKQEDEEWAFLDARLSLHVIGEVGEMSLGRISTSCCPDCAKRAIKSEIYPKWRN